MHVANPLGRKGEDIACKFLLQKGYKIIERNFRKSYAEIDIIGTKDNTLVFIEVKTRTSTNFGAPFESITYWKLKPLIKTAQFYASIHPKLPQALRIDAIAVYIKRDSKVEKIDHIENITS